MVVYGLRIRNNKMKKYALYKRSYKVESYKICKVKEFMKENKEQNNEDFDRWNNIKKDINAQKVNTILFPQLGEIWMCALGKNIGREQNGGGKNFSRPMLVIKKFNNEIFWVLPLSTKQKKIDFYYNFKDKNNQDVSVIISQIRLIYIKRFERKLYDMDTPDVVEIKKRLREYLI
ncbi:hypothetical protein A3B85_02200 [Candidatus Nomurabacteria bacterium RIFCSPHIGHO2_02_FULL_37_13]|uniref:Toxin-antitoxin system protein n=1 Tax=Candidatus Nomurabacteria bacterium RIFCSPHIGHO2_02_FULL_37_13 TaxID=1801750 RepID=A0A1F6W5R0_9BACT|nr:MAG: hypothetical protein A3B85_02200 [Candidatus Nomurabacteria bacterium RIFCSPHIGHO2_02_FULL_37_13]